MILTTEEQYQAIVNEKRKQIAHDYPLQVAKKIEWLTAKFALEEDPIKRQILQAQIKEYQKALERVKKAVAHLKQEES